MRVPRTSQRGAKERGDRKAGKVKEVRGGRGGERERERERLVYDFGRRLCSCIHTNINYTRTHAHILHTHTHAAQFTGARELQLCEPLEQVIIGMGSSSTGMHHPGAVAFHAEPHLCTNMQGHAEW